MYFIIVEVEDGFMAASVADGEDPERVASEQGGRLVDSGPFRDMEEANDAIAELEPEEQRD